MDNIVVGVDGSETAAAALRWAVREADLHGRRVVAVLSWGFLDQHHAEEGVTFDPEYDEAKARAALDAYVQAAVGPDTAAQVERHTPCDLPAPALVAASADAALLVVGARGLGGFKGLLLGSVSQHCLHHARCPIAIVRDEPAPAEEPERIVVGVDGSDTGTRALRWAVAEAKARGAVLEVLHSWHLPYASGYPYTVVAFDPALFEDAARHTLDGAVAAVDTTGLAHPVRTILAEGSPAGNLLEAGTGAALIVCGTRGLGGFKGLLLGSVSHQLAQHATGPVVLVPRDA